MVAFELAWRLRRAGYNVRPLTLLDTMCPDTDERVCRECTRVEALMELVALYEDSAKQSLGIDASQFEELDPPAQIAVVHARAGEIGVMPQRSSPKGSPRPTAGARGRAANHLSTRAIVRLTGKFSACVKRPEDMR